MKSPKIFTTACLCAFCGLASAYSITGSVSDEDGKAIKGASVRKNELGGFQYTYPTVAYRTFYERNYYFPFTRKEIANGGGSITQNPEYN